MCLSRLKSREKKKLIIRLYPLCSSISQSIFPHSMDAIIRYWFHPPTHTAADADADATHQINSLFRLILYKRLQLQTLFPKLLIAAKCKPQLTLLLGSYRIVSYSCFPFLLFHSKVTPTFCFFFFLHIFVIVDAGLLRWWSAPASSSTHNLWANYMGFMSSVCFPCFLFLSIPFSPFFFKIKNKKFVSLISFWLLVDFQGRDQTNQQNDLGMFLKLLIGYCQM